VDRRLAARFLAELADVPGGDIERLVELRGRDLGVRDSRLQDLETLGDFRGNISMAHDGPPLRTSSRLCIPDRFPEPAGRRRHIEAPEARLPTVVHYRVLKRRERSTEAVLAR